MPPPFSIPKVSNDTTPIVHINIDEKTDVITIHWRSPTMVYKVYFFPCGRIDWTMTPLVRLA